jgi:HEPN domain-containing protein
MQLYTKAVYYEPLGDYPREHRIKELISILIKELRAKEFQEEVGCCIVDDKFKYLWILVNTWLSE